MLNSKLISSLNKCINSDLIELSIFDCGSNDVTSLESQIKTNWKGKLVFKSEKTPFSRAYSFNNSVKQCTNDIIFICDADFSVPKNIVALCNKYSIGKMIWFPIVFYLYKNKPEEFSKKNGEWMIWGGKGLLACKKKHFFEVGMLDEKYKSWGYEDEELWLRFYKKGYWVFRTKNNELLHHWHPSLNSKYQKIEELCDIGLL